MIQTHCNPVFSRSAFAARPLRVWLTGCVALIGAMFSFAYSVQAQPPVVSGLRLHLDAGAPGAVELAGDEVVEWRAAAGAGIAFRPSGAGDSAPPRFVPSAVNGLPVVRFASSSLETQSPGALSIMNDIAGMTMFAVGWNTDTGLQNYFRIGAEAPASPSNVRMLFGRTTTEHRIQGRRLHTDSFQTVAGGERLYEEWGVDSAVVDFAAARAAVYINGTLVAGADAFQTPGRTAAADSQRFWLGSNHVPAQYWQGDIAEILIYDRVLEDWERRSVEMYLANKYGLAGFVPLSALGIVRVRAVEFDSHRDRRYQAMVSNDGSTWTGWFDEPRPGAGERMRVVLPPDAGTGGIRVIERQRREHVPSGASSPQVPVVDGLRVQLDASDSATLGLSGEFVEIWQSARGEGISFVAPTLGARPVYVQEAANGRPAVAFETGRFLETSSPAALGMTNNVSGITAFAVGWNTGDETQTYFRIGAGNSANPLRFMLGRRSGDHRLLARRVDGGPFAQLAGGERRFEQWGIDSGFIDYANARAGLYIDGVEAAVSDRFLDTGTTSATDSLMFRVGRDHDNQYWRGNIAEILIYDRVLDERERDLVGVYFSDKYGIPYTYIRETDLSFEVLDGVALTVETEQVARYEFEESGDLGGWFDRDEAILGTGRMEQVFEPFGGAKRAFFRARARQAYGIHPFSLPNEGILFVDHEAAGRSGHGGHAITEAANGDIIAFYSNVSGEVWGGHSVSGWSEYKISGDGGQTWSEPYVLEYSLDVWEGSEFHSALVDEVMTAPNGTLVAIAGRYTDFDWSRTTPVYLLSYDHGLTWNYAGEVDPGADTGQIAREHASLVHDGVLYVLFDCREPGTGRIEPHRLYVSTDNGETFEGRSTLPFARERWYGAMTVTPAGELIAYSYHAGDEHRLHYTISYDGGFTWSEVGTTFLAKRIRNPQVSEPIDGIYFMHGRSGHEGDNPRHLVLYSSPDGIHWDEGVFLNVGSTTDLDSYSTNEVVGRHDPGRPERLLIQSSIAYDGSRKVNIHHWWIEFPEQAEP